MSEKTSNVIFDKRYNQLNIDQKEAVDTIYGPVMVIAGPGTGKTTILSLRIANILKQTDIGPDSILAITFTEAGVISMRKKLLETIGKEAHNVTITTFHGYCNGLIKSHPEYFPEIISSEQSSDAQIIELIENIIDRDEWPMLKPSGDKYNYVWPIKSAITHLKKEGYSPEQYKKYQEKLIKEIEDNDENYTTRGAVKGAPGVKDGKKLKAVALKEIDKAKKGIEMAEFYKQFEAEKLARKIYDYDDMILKVLEKLKSDDTLLALQQEKFQFILADEHQDSNSAQNQILEVLTSFDENPNLFIVGDEKQAIFRFQGASLENFLYFKKKFPTAKIIKLKDNYRSNQQILDASFGLIKNNQIEKDVFVELKSFTGQSKSPALNFTKFTNVDEENYSITQNIKNKIESGVLPNEIAIIYRNHAESEDLARYLESFDIKFSIKTNKNLLDDYDICNLRDIFKVLVDLNNDTAVSNVLFTSLLKNSPSDLHKIISHASKNKISIFSIISDPKLLQKIKVLEIEKVLDFAQNIFEVSKSAKTQSAVKTFVQVLNDLKIIEEILNSNTSLERMQKINVFFNELRESAKQKKLYLIADFNAHLDRLERYNIEIKDKNNYLNKGVNLMTAHGSKGLEFDFVFIPHLESKIWGKGSRGDRFILPYGNDSDFTKNSEIEDERRLLFVAMTRARTEINLSYADYNEKGDELLPSIFLEEIDQKHLNIVPSRQIDLMPILQAKFSNNKAVSEQDKEYLKDLFLNTSFSVSALNNYLSCPWEYFYRNLIRIPAIYSKEQVYGNVIHGVISELSKNMKASQKDKEKIYRDFVATQVEKSDLNLDDRKFILDKCLNNAEGIIEMINYDNAEEIISEAEMSNVAVEFAPEKSLKLKGIFDHIIIYKDGLVVVDYKTGRPKTVNEILGKTGDKKGDYYRQLVFYKMLLANSKYKEIPIKEMRLHFTGGENQEFEMHSFRPTNDEVKELEAQIKEVANEIYSFGFWDKKCNKKDCEFCKLPQPK
jgi:DNA helicase-2/ATP-dependent DNA helicase PcrA